LDNVKKLPEFQNSLFHLDHAFFKEKSLPPIEEIPALSTFDFLGQYEEVVRANHGGLNYKGARIPLSNVQISVDLLEERLRAIQYPDLQILDYLKYGWPVGDEEGAGYTWPIQEWRPTATRRNRLSAYANFRFVDKFINKQVAANRIAGPFNLEMSPFQGTLPHLVPIKVAETVGKLRVILQTFVLNQHTSSPVYPDGAPAYSRPHIYQFAKVLGRLGPGAWLWKRDLRSFYLQLPLDPRDYPKLCFIWRSKLYFLPTFIWGLKQANNNGQRFSSALATLHTLCSSGKFNPKRRNQQFLFSKSFYVTELEKKKKFHKNPMREHRGRNCLVCDAMLKSLRVA